MDSQLLLQKLTFGVAETIDSHIGVYNVKPETCRPADRQTVLTWEQKNATMLPEDLKNFYLTSDGLNITWSVKMDNGPFNLGKLWINPLCDLTRLGGGSGGTNGSAPSLCDLDIDSDEEEDDSQSGRRRPRWDGSCKLFELDSCDGAGKVCLVYNGCKTGSLDPKPEVWFLDRALRWHYLCDSFTDYYRLLLMHMGLPQWQYVFTDAGLSCQAKQWFHLFAPLRLELDQEIHLEHHHEPVPSHTDLTQIDSTRIFKSKTEKKKQSTSAPANTQAQKKKGVLPGNKTPTGNLKHGSSTTQTASKIQK